MSRVDTTVAVIVASYGDQKWKELSKRAIRSIEHQGADQWIIEHQADGDIASCRNAAAASATAETLVFLDADDELQPGYVQAIRNAYQGPAMYTPRVSYVNKGRAQPPKFWPERPLSQGNWLVIGTAIPRAAFLEVGGFESDIHGYEDWSLWARIWKQTGLQPVKVPQAVYVAHVTPGSRNKRMSRPEQLYWHQRIGNNIFPETYDAPTDAEDRARALHGKGVRQR